MIRNNSIFLDRDYIQTQNGDLYQVIGSIHPNSSIIALQKYQKVQKSAPNEYEENAEIEAHKALIPSKNSLATVKSHNFSYWIQKNTNDHFVRILPNYSSESAHENIKPHPYRNFSPIFQMDLILIPLDAIQHHFQPELRLSDLIKIVNSRDFKQQQALDSLERETLEVIFILERVFQLNLKNVGITGSILWNGHHKMSDIDLMLYGQYNLHQILSGPRSSLGKIRSYMKIEILPLAEKMAVKTGLPMEECFEYIYKKPYQFFFGDRKISITFAPTTQELIHYPFFTNNSQFHPLHPIKLRARIKSDQWGYYYPGVFEIQTLEIIETSKTSDNISVNQITRLVVYEHELVGYYGVGDKVEICGLLQNAQNVPEFEGFGEIDTFQVLVGGFETFGKEYIRRLQNDEKR